MKTRFSKKLRLTSNDYVNSFTVDIKIEFETTQSISKKYSTYCLILHDQIITHILFNRDA